MKYWREEDNLSILEIDGAWKKSGQGKKDSWIAAYGWSLNKNNDETRKGGGRSFACSPLHAEAEALRLSLKHIKTFNIKSFKIWTDCEELVKSMSKPKSANSAIRTIIRDIDEMLRKSSNVRIIHVSRNKIKKAHNLSSRARKEQYQLY